MYSQSIHGLLLPYLFCLYSGRSDFSDRVLIIYMDADEKVKLEFRLEFL